MKFDILAAIEITACAAVAIATLAIAFGSALAARLRIAAALALWFALVVGLALGEAFATHGVFGTPGLGVAALLPIVVLASLVLAMPSLRSALVTIPVSSLVGVNAIRLFGVTFVLLYAANRLPAPFAPVAGWGDILVGLLALPVAWLASKRGVGAAVLAWNTLGLLDLVAAVSLGVISSPGPQQLIHVQPSAALMTTLPWLLIPGFLVPLLASTHFAVFYRLQLARRESRAFDGARAAYQ